MPYVHLLWDPQQCDWLLETAECAFWRHVRLWKGARVVTSMTPNTLYTRTNSLLMCFGVSFHRRRIVRLTPAFEGSVHQLQWNRCFSETVCPFCRTDWTFKTQMGASRFFSTPGIFIFFVFGRSLSHSLIAPLKYEEYMWTSCRKIKIL